jgi:uncharacterized protein involved in cysteine biosynthesis
LIAIALTRAFRDLFQPKVLWIVVWPVLAATAFWVISGAVFWDTVSLWIERALEHAGALDWLGTLHPRWLANGIQAMLHMILFVPLIFLTTLLITALFAMPALIGIVAEQHEYRGLDRKQGGSIASNIINASAAMMVFLAIWALTLPLWLIGIGVLVPFLAASYLNQRLFRFDALAEHASWEEMNYLFRSDRASWWGLGLATGMLQFVPLLNLFAPVVTGLAFIHFGLARLALLRQPGTYTHNS